MWLFEKFLKWCWFLSFQLSKILFSPNPDCSEATVIVIWESSVQHYKESTDFVTSSSISGGGDVTKIKMDLYKSEFFWFANDFFLALIQYTWLIRLQLILADIGTHEPIAKKVFLISAKNLLLTAHEIKTLCWRLSRHQEQDWV